MKKSVRVLARYKAAEITRGPIVALLEPTSVLVHLSKTRAARRYTLRGVPGKRLHVVVQEIFHNGEVPVIEICRKYGRYDGHSQLQLCFRTLPAHQTLQLEAARFAANVSGGRWDVRILDPVSLTDRQRWYFNMLPHVGYSADMRQHKDPFGQIVVWHAQRWFRHLWDHHREDVLQLAASFWPEQDAPTKAELNRAASRALYQLSRELGWVKLTQKQQAKRGLAAAWQKAVDAYGHPTGCGEHTLSAAHGHAAGV